MKIINENITETDIAEITETTEIIQSKPKYRKHSKAKKRYVSNAYKVTDEYLLYAISDSGLLHLHLHGVHKDKDGNKIFYFDRCDEIKKVIDGYVKPEIDEWLISKED